MLRLELSDDALGPVSRGHPWVYASGIKGPRPRTGEPVLLTDRRNRPVGFGLADSGDIAVRVLGRQPDHIRALLARRISSAAAARPALLPPETDAYRLINGAGDGLPGLVADRYGSLVVLRVYGACWLRHLDAVVDQLAIIDGVTSVMRRLGVRRVDGGDGHEVLFGPPPPETIVVTEHGLRFLVRPTVGQKTGLFLDQREHRHRVGALSRSADSVVNLFAYTGGFSVSAAAAGAKRVTTVDISSDAIEDARENFRLNGLDPDAHVFAAEDAFRYTPEQKPDVLVCDPPSLSRSQKSDRQAGRAYQDLAEQCGKQLSGGGLLATASCTARLSQERWEQAIRDGLRKSGRWSWLWRAAEPPDHPVHTQHPEGRYLKFGLLRRLQ
jgi:23S rRNA (cytosine1962-C5)-methyltransferase